MHSKRQNAEQRLARRSNQNAVQIHIYPNHLVIQMYITSYIQREIKREEDRFKIEKERDNRSFSSHIFGIALSVVPPCFFDHGIDAFFFESSLENS